MSKQTQSSMAFVGVVAGGIGLVAFVVMLVFGAGFLLALFGALLLAAGVAILLYKGFHEKWRPQETAHPAPVAAVEPEPVAAPDPAPAVASDPAPAATVEPEPVAEAESAAEAEVEPNAVPDVAAAPGRLNAPRDDKADDLKKIKGVGPKMEAMLNGMGFYHYDQIASWSAEEVAWVDDNLEGFKGRVSRDNWVEQARTLASGGETEFSKKVDKGGVY